MMTRRLLFLFLVSVSFCDLVAQDSKKTEPTNAKEAAAKEAAAKKAEADRVVNEKYAAMVAKVPADEQAWERVLQGNLGSFYLPIHKRQKVKSQSNAWDFVRDDPKLPRVLLIGDSVSRGYTQAVRKALAGKANVHRAPANCGPTATGVKKLDVWLGQGDWDLIHFNFGIHDRKTPLKEYEARLAEIVKRLKAAGDKVVWASSTPIPDDWKSQANLGKSMVERNAVAAKLMKEQGVTMNDLFAFISPQLKETQNPRDVHFNSEGYNRLGGQVARTIERALNGE